MSLTLGLTTAISGLSTAQKGLDLVSHNISNVNTEGYTRKIFNPESRVVNGAGAGVQTGSITREVDENLLKDIREEIGTLNTLEIYDRYYQRMQDMFGETGDNSSVAHMISKLNEDLESLALTPSSATTQNNATDSAVRVVERLNGMGEDIQDLRLLADQAIESYVSEVNTLLSNISDLNDDIVQSIATGQSGTPDLQDKRDQQLYELSQLMDVQSFVSTNGEAVVFSAGGTSLVDSTAQTITHTALTSVSAWNSHAGGDIGEINVSGGTDITEDISSGKLYGLIQMRDQILPDLQAEIDQLAHQMREEVNKVHNRGVSYPEMATSYTGTRTFLVPGTQTMTLSSGDATLVVTDSTGAQTASTTLETIMQAAGFGTGAQAAGGPWDMTEVMATVEDWLQDTTSGPGLTTATATVATNGEVSINLDTTSYSLYFRDESATADNSSRSDVTIAFDSDGDGTNDETYYGFSNFLGLNDFYTTSQANWAWDSTIMSSSAQVGTAGTLNFSDETNGLIFDTIAVTATDTLSTIADNINNDSALAAVVTAEVVSEGAGQRLRITHDSGEEMFITQNGGTALVSALGLERSTVAASQYMSVNADIDANPQLMSRGALQYSSDLSEYYVSAGDNLVANELADMFTDGQSFNLAGDLSASTRTFENYADAILGLNAVQANNFEIDLDYQRGLTESLELKRAEISSVNLDEELANLIVFEQSYAAAGRVISTIDRMLEILNSIAA